MTASSPAAPDARNPTAADWERYEAAKARLTPAQIERIKAKCQWEHMSWRAVWLNWPSLFGEQP